VRRPEEERVATSRLLGQLPPAVDMCSNHIGQFPDDAPPATVTIPPRKVANRLGEFRESWRDQESFIRKEVREAYDDVGIEQVLREIPQNESPSTDYAALVR
jgi:hypothetical protein